MSAIRAAARAALFVVGLLPVLAPLPAAGQGDDMARAREAYSRGQALFDAGRHEEALVAFDESLAAFPHFRTIFNIGLCHEKLGNIAAAVEMYQRYADWPSEVPNREEVRTKLAELRLLLPPEPAEDRAEAGEETGPPGPPPAQPAPPPEPGPGADPGPDLRLPGWIAVGVGAAGLVAGGALLGLAQKRAAEIAAVDGVPYDPDTHDRLQSQGEAFETGGWIAGSLGVALIASGLAMLLVSRPGDEEGEGEPRAGTAWAAPVEGGLGLGWGGSF
jgi:tetratricopeptide (TPR) repeat protein